MAPLFDTVAELYDEVRPSYPEQVFKLLKEKTGIAENSVVLEVGCGTGQATRHLRLLSADLTCIDVGENMLNINQQNHSDVNFIHSSFEEFETVKKFDLIVSATSWHLMDETTKYTKSYELLKPNGFLAVLTNFHIERDPSAFHNRADYIYKKYLNSEGKNLSGEQKLDDQRIEMENNLFNLSGEITIEWAQEYLISEYIQLRRTYSDHLKLDNEERKNFEQELTSFANTNFNGVITKNYVTSLLIAKKL